MQIHPVLAVMGMHSKVVLVSHLLILVLQLKKLLILRLMVLKMVKCGPHWDGTDEELKVLI